MKLEDRLKELREKATPEPWSLPLGGGYEPVDHEGCDVWPWYRGADADLAYFAVNALPALEELLGASRDVLAEPEGGITYDIYLPGGTRAEAARRRLEAALLACDSIP